MSTTAIAPPAVKNDAAPKLTPEDLLALPERERFELVDGQLVEREMSHSAVWISARIIYFIQAYLMKNPIGDVYSEGGSYQCFPEESSRIRRPDVSFIRTGRLPLEQFERGHVRIAPDLAVEVISPSDLHYDVNSKLEDYFSAGIPLVWLVNPDTRTVTVYREKGTSITRLQFHDTLTGEDILPGFTCPVKDIFPPLTKN